MIFSTFNIIQTSAFVSRSFAIASQLSFLLYFRHHHVSLPPTKLHHGLGFIQKPKLIIFKWASYSLPIVFHHIKVTAKSYSMTYKALHDLASDQVTNFISKLFSFSLFVQPHWSSCCSHNMTSMFPIPHLGLCYSPYHLLADVFISLLLYCIQVSVQMSPSQRKCQ